MSGLPGVGKDTWLARSRPELPVVSLDAVREDLDVDATDNQDASFRRRESVAASICAPGRTLRLTRPI